MIPAPITTQHSKGNILTDNLTICIYGSTGSGKTPLIGELAEYYFKHFQKRTRIYASDKGGWETIKPYVKLGVIDIIPMFGDPWVWVNNSVQGMKLEKGQWVPGIDPQIGLYAFEGMTSMADNCMSWMANSPVAIGGASAASFVAGEGKERLKVGGNNLGHYRQAQGFVYEKSTQSQFLPGTIIWTAGDSRGEDDAVGGVVGPQVAGKALTGEVPRWFKYTFQLTVDTQPGQPTKHILHLDHHTDMNSKGMAKAISNARVPLDGGEEVEIPASIEPASLVRALELIHSRQGAAESAIAKRLGLSKA